MQLKCTECNYDNQLSLGAGSIPIQIESAKALFHGDVAKSIEKWLEKHEIVHYDIDKALGYCKACNIFEEMQTITFSTSKGNKTFQNICVICQGKMQKMDFLHDDLMCPQCNNILAKDVVGFWD